MDSEQLAKFEAVLTEACEAAVAAGLSISDGLFVDSGDGQVCPIGAACIPFKEDGFIDYGMMLTARLGFPITHDEMWSFIDGFDIPDGEPLPKQNKTKSFAL